MSVMQVLYFPDDPLTQQAESVDEFGDKLEKLAADMLETMHDYRGVGLAAPQVGLSKRFFVYQEPEGPEMCLVNPEILTMEGSEVAEEGCLSMPEVYAQVPRATRIEVRAYDVRGKAIEMEAHDFHARIIQHETDHLNGVLFPERLDIITRQEKLEQWKVVRERLLAEQTRSDDAT